MLSGSRIGIKIPLDPAGETLLGRGSECQISLADPLCSRVHARLTFQDGQWVLRDANSRNGTFVNDKKVAEARLDEGHSIRIGGSEFEYHSSDEPPTADEVDAQLNQTIVQDVPIAADGTREDPLAGLPTAEQVKELMLLYQLTIKLLGCSGTDKVVHAALDLLHKRTNASLVGFLSVDDEGQLRPKVVVPADAADKVSLSPKLTDLVLRQGHAVWVANQGTGEGGQGKGDGAQELEHFADAVCVPLVRRGGGAKQMPLGAMHVYLQNGRFRQSDFDFIISVANLVVVALDRALEMTSLQSEYQRLAQHSPGFDELVGESEPMRQLKVKIARVAKASGCVLLRGESGSGKELVARAIHRSSPRADRPMVCVNCAAIPAELMESQLFGHKSGAFTGADRDHSGFFQQADMGTLFLDEVGELTLEGQAKLLRILEGHPFLSVGATREVKVDVRVIAATNQDLQTYVRQRKFREDLFYRLSVFELHLPSLRERADDVGRLIDFFLAHFRREHGRPQLKLSEKARTKLLAYHWPGNVRQLRNVIDSAVVMADGEEIRTSDLALRDSGAVEIDTLDIEQWEKKLIVEALRRASGNVPDAAKLLGLGRATLYRKIEQYHVER